MAADRLRDSTLPTALSNVVADVAELFQKEFSSREPNFRTSCPRRFVVDIGCSLRPFSSSLRLPSFVRPR